MPKGDPKKTMTHYPQRVQLQEGDANGLVVLFSSGSDLDVSEHESYYMNREAWLKLADAVRDHFATGRRQLKPTEIN